MQRTLVGSTLSKEKKDEIIFRMKNVLITYAIRNPYIGYCQGFNFIVSEILINEIEEEV